MRPDRPLLVLDTASPTVSVALGTSAGDAVSRTLELRRTSERLLWAVEEVLDEAGWSLPELGGVAALQGPGSFTGLRIGLATVLGWHQALGLPATALPTLEVLTRAADAGAAGGPPEVVAAVDAQRGDWYTRRFRRGESVGEAALVAEAELPRLPPCRLVGFGLARLAAEDGPRGAGVEVLEPPPLAPHALALAAESDWDAEALSSPIYFRPPAVTAPKPLDRPFSRC